eukprot:8532120-Pyramimonas_sp.AAC.1
MALSRLTFACQAKHTCRHRRKIRLALVRSAIYMTLGLFATVWTIFPYVRGAVPKHTDMPRPTLSRAH